MRCWFWTPLVFYVQALRRFILMQILKLVANIIQPWHINDGDIMCFRAVKSQPLKYDLLQSNLQLTAIPPAIPPEYYSTPCLSQVSPLMKLKPYIICHRIAMLSCDFHDKFRENSYYIEYKALLREISTQF